MSEFVRIPPTDGNQFDAGWLLSDGSVLLSAWSAGPAPARNWWRLHPDALGGYSLPAVRLAPPPSLLAASGVNLDASCIAPDGRLCLWGEWTGGRFLAAFDQTTDSWSVTSRSDAPWAVLRASPILDGTRFLLLGRRGDAVIWNAADDSVRTAAAPGAFFASPTLAPLADGSLLLLTDGHGRGDPPPARYFPDEDRWVPIAVLGGEIIGPTDDLRVVTLPGDGRAVAFASRGIAWRYSPGATRVDPGAWVMAGQLDLGAADLHVTFYKNGCVLPDGSLLIATAGAARGGCMTYRDGAFTQIAGAPVELVPSQMLPLPSGQVLMLPQARGDTVRAAYLFRPDGSAPAAWRPALEPPASPVGPGTWQPLAGVRLSGVSVGGFGQPSHYTDSTNIPIARLRDPASGRVWYCSTRGVSSRAIAPGEARQHARFLVPSDVPPGATLRLAVVTSAIASDEVTLSIDRQAAAPPKTPAVQWVFGNLADGQGYTYRPPHVPQPVNPGPAARPDAPHPDHSPPPAAPPATPKGSSGTDGQ